MTGADSGTLFPIEVDLPPATVEGKFRFDRDAGNRGCVVGIDEAGRGPWAGPVVAAAVSFPPEVDLALLSGLNDSKKLTARRRSALAEIIAETAFATGIGVASPGEIDRDNILQATFLAMRRALEDCGIIPDLVLVDGNRDPDLGSPTRCIVKGDATSAAIAAASILAKTTRDRHMELIAEEEDGDPWGFAQHKGYGTEYHLRAIAVFGACRHHRKSFRPVCRFLDRPKPSSTFLSLWQALSAADSRPDREEIRQAIQAKITVLEANEAWILARRLEDLFRKTQPRSREHSNRRRGDFHESAVLGYIAQKGYTLLEKNYQTREGEVDLIARDGNTIVFVEVKMRTSDRFGTAADAVDLRKRRRIVRAAKSYLSVLEEDRDCRFDVIALDRSKDDGSTHLVHYPNAFELTDDFPL
jgi:ribonuclease HII